MPDVPEIPEAWAVDGLPPGAAMLLGRAAVTLRTPQITTQEAKEAAAVLRAHGLSRQANVFDTLLSDGRPAAVALLPATRRKRRGGGINERDVRRNVYLEMRDRLDPTHTESVRSVHRTIEKMIEEYGKGRWRVHRKLNSQPPPGNAKFDDLLWRLHRVTRLKTINLKYDAFLSATKKIVR